MPKKTENVIETLADQAEELAKALRALAGGAAEEGEATDAVTIPEPDAVAELAKGDLPKLAAQLGIESEGVKPVALRALLATAAAIFHDEGVDELEEDAVTALAEACGISEGKPAKMLAALKKYLEAGADSEKADDADEDDADEAPAKKKKKAAEDDDDNEESSEDDDDDDDADEKPAKKGKKPADDDDEDGEEAESSDDDDDDDDEVSPKEQAKRLTAYNKFAKKAAKNYAALVALLKDDDDNAVEWGTPYIKGETAYCCGLPLKDVKVTVDGEKVEAGKCLVTGKVFNQDEDANLVEVEVD